MSTSGSGGISFETQKFALGQRIKLITDSTETSVIEDAIDTLTTVPGDLLNVLNTLFGSDDDGGDPSFGYDPSAKWLAGFDVTYGVLTLDVLLVDGSFYGLLIKIGKEDDKKDGGENGGNDGGEAGGGNEGETGGGGKEQPLAGLELEIIYRKINDHLGEFSGDLTLPEKYSKIAIGVASLTLPSVGLAVWTNGDFKVSIGWPLGERSFNIMFPPDPIPWAGGGGFYFARLRSEDDPGELGTDLNPIIEFGIGLRIGAGTEGNFGIASYSASLYLFGTFQGVLAWQQGGFSEGVDYYWFCATVGITGHLEGSVDFVIIKVTLALDVTASLTLALETDHAAEGVAEFKAEVTASIHIIFFTIHFSFGLDIKLKVKFGSGTAASITGPSFDTEAVAAFAAAPAVFLQSREVLEVAAHSAPEPINLSLLLAPTIRHDGGQWIPAGVASLVIERAAPTDSKTTDDFGDPFAKLVQSLAHFLLKTYANYEFDSPLTVDHLTAVLTALGDPQPGSQPAPSKFTNDVIHGWLNANFSFTVTGLTNADKDKAATPGAVFPMIPGLTLTYGSQTTTFGDEKAPANYLDVLRRYLASLSPVSGGENSATQEVGTATIPPGPSWFPGVVFEDYFNLIAKQLISQLKDWMTTLTDGKVPAEGTLDQDLKQVSVGNLAGIGTRFLQHGLRVPDPTDISKALVDMNLIGLYAMTGQQFDVADSDLDATVGVVAAPKVNVTIADGKASLPFELKQPPADNPLWHPAALKRIAPMPLTIMLRQGVKWQAANNNWLIFGFPDPLQHELRQRTALSLSLTSTGGVSAPTPVKGVEGLLIRFSLSVIPGLGNDTHVFQVTGTNEETRDLIEHLLANPAELAAAEIDLLLPAGAPNSGAGYRRGGTATLLKTNLSSVSQPDISAMFAAAQAVNASDETPLGPTSSVTDTKPPTEFLRLLWECSIVHTGGFYLSIPDLKPTDRAFAGKKRLEVALMVKKAGSADESTVAVDIFHNTILVDATGFNAGDRVQAEVFESDAKTRVTTPQPNYLPGTASFGASWEQAPVAATAGDTTAYAESLYQLLQYRVSANDLFEESPWSMPLGPHGTGTTWSYRRSAPVARLLKTGSSNRYAAIGQKANLDLQLVDVFGNAFGLDPLSVTPVYNDRLIPLDEWPAVKASYAFSPGASGAAELTVTITFQSDQVQHQQNATQVYQTVFDQLSDGRTNVTFITAMAAAGVTLSPDPQKTLLEFVQTILASLDKEGQPPPPLSLTGTVPTDHVTSGITEDLFPIWVSMVTSRDVSWEQPAFDYPSGFVRVTSLVPPLLSNEAAQPTALRTWAQNFEQAYDGFGNGQGLLKVLVGKPPTKVSATLSPLGKSPAAAVTSAPGDLWAIKWGAGVGVDITFANEGGEHKPVYFAPLPLSTALLNGSTKIFDYQPNGELNLTGISKSFHNVDLDSWARSFLKYVDNLLAPELATAIAQVDNGKSFAALLQVKEDLAFSISSHVARVFKDQLTAGDKQAAQVRFRESLLASLGNDYSTSAIVQVPAMVSVTGAVESGQSDSPQLFGSVVPENSTDEKTLKQYTISTSSLPIEKADPAYLSFLVAAVHPTEKADLCLKFSYDIEFIDHRFETSQEKFGYVPSSWLRFVLPETGPKTTTPPTSVLEAPMGQLDIPIPLRAYPSAPHLIQQQAQASNLHPTSVEEALRWAYLLTVQRPVAAQDDLHLTIEFNDVQDPSTPAEKAAQGDTLFDALARFQEQAPGIDLTKIQELQADAANWLSDVRTLVTDVSKAWRKHVESLSPEVESPPAGPSTLFPAPIVWDYVLQVPDETTRTVHLAWNGQGTAPDWPTVGGVTGKQLPNQKLLTFAYHNIPEDQWDQLRITWKDLPVVMMQSALTSAFIKRNETLSGCGGQNRSEQTNPAFVYTTSRVTFSSRVIPLLNVPDKLAISDNTVAQAVADDLIEKIIPSTPPPTTPTQAGMSIEAGYEFALVPQLSTSLPVLLAKSEVSNAATPAAGVETSVDFGSNIVSALKEWHTDFRPAETMASMHFDVTVFAANSQQPLARLLDVEAKIGTGWWG